VLSSIAACCLERIDAAGKRRETGLVTDKAVIAERTGLKLSANPLGIHCPQSKKLARGRAMEPRASLRGGQARRETVCRAM
jgi:hypothetical protein